MVWESNFVVQLQNNSYMKGQTNEENMTYRWRKGRVGSKPESAVSSVSLIVRTKFLVEKVSFVPKVILLFGFSTAVKEYTIQFKFRKLLECMIWGALCR